MVVSDLSGELARTGATVPLRYRDHLLEALSTDLPHEFAEIVHLEYLRELFGVFGDGHVLDPSVTGPMTAKENWGYVSPEMEKQREGWTSKVEAAARKADLLPRWERTLDPLERAHWWLVGNEKPTVRQRYFEFVASLKSSRMDPDHRKLRGYVGLEGTSSPTTIRELRNLLIRLFEESDGGIDFQRERSGRNTAVFGMAVGNKLDLLLVFEDLGRAMDPARAELRLAIRLVAREAKMVASPTLEGFVFEVPLSAMVPGGYIYNNIQGPEELLVGLAYNVRLFEILALAFTAGFTNVEVT